MSLRPKDHTALQALAEIAALMRLHHLQLEDISAYLGQSAQDSSATSPARAARADLAFRLFSYLGATLIFAGLCVFTGVIWPDLSSLPRVIITFGAGFTAYLCGVFFARDPRFARAATPAFIAAFLLQPTGLFVALNEYASGHDAALGGMIVFAPLALQQALTWLALRRPSVLFFALLYFCGFAFSAGHYTGVDTDWLCLVLGAFLVATGFDLIRREPYADLTPFLFILGPVTFFSGLYSLIGQTPLDPAILSITLALLYAAISHGSKTLYAMSMIMIAGYFLGGPGGGWMDWDFHQNLAALFTGASLALAGHWLRRAPYISLAPFWTLAGSLYAFYGLHSLLSDGWAEPAFIALAALGIYGALVMRSRAMLAAAVLALLSFIGDYSARYFAGSLGWPVVLMLVGFSTLACGFLFTRISGKIRQTAP